MDDELHIIGESSNISKHLIEIFNKKKINVYNRDSLIFSNPIKFVENLCFNTRHNFVYLSGILYNKKISDQNMDEIAKSFEINCWVPCQLIERLNDKSKIRFKFVYISSESAKKGSYDSSYALSKTATERFIREIKLKNHYSSCIGIAPSTIEDAGMTINRKDKERLNKYRSEHPKQRFLSSFELANFIYDIINSKTDYLTNTVIDLNGGKFARNTF